MLTRNQIAWRVAQEIADGALVNLGLRMPVAVADFVGEERDIFFQSENGVYRGRSHRSRRSGRLGSH